MMNPFAVLGLGASVTYLLYVILKGDTRREVIKEKKRSSPAPVEDSTRMPPVSSVQQRADAEGLQMEVLTESTGEMQPAATTKALDMKPQFETYVPPPSVLCSKMPANLHPEGRFEDMFLTDASKMNTEGAPDLTNWFQSEAGYSKRMAEILTSHHCRIDFAPKD